VQDAAGTGNTEESFQVAGVIPHHGSDAITGTEAELDEGRGEAARAAVEVTVASAHDGAIGTAGGDLDAGEEFVRTFEERGQRERKVHHRAAHESLAVIRRELGRLWEPRESYHRRRPRVSVGAAETA
jgi:hypothetical protein